jgi:hypothetical protein
VHLGDERGLTVTARQPAPFSFFNKESCMEILNEMLRSLGRIEGQVQHIPKLADRISQLERWQYWLKGACAALAIAFACLYKLALIK